jgi:DNA-binding SARP family transcriptional activator
MNLKEALDSSYKTFFTHAPNAKLILLHPESKLRTVLMAKLMSDNKHRAISYALSPDDVTLQTFVNSLTRHLADYFPLFGRHTYMLPQSIYENAYESADAIVQTFAQDLAEITQDEFFLILDEYDRSDRADEVQIFVEKLSANLPENIRLVINSRTLPRLPWAAMIAHGRATLLRDSELVMDNFYGIKNERGVNGIEISALSRGDVIIQNRKIDGWEGHLPRLLFFFTLDRALVTRSEICRSFWPGLDEDQAVNVFHVTKRRLHKAMEYDALVHDESYYHINWELPLYYDIIEFSHMLLVGRTTTDATTRVKAWERAVEIHRAPFLYDHTEDWILQRRKEFKVGFAEAIRNLVVVYSDTKREDEALMLLNKGINLDIHNEDYHRDLMRLYAKLGRRSEIASHYQRLSDIFRQQNHSFSDETHQLYQELMG